MSKIILFTGGARSGKSACAERYAALQPGPVAYVATAEPGDDEMRARIAQHRQRRPDSWQTLECPSGVGAAISGLPRGTTVLLDCLSLLVSNLLLANERDPAPLVEREVAAMLAAARGGGHALLVVTSEVGMGVVPEYPLGRAYRDLLGRAAQQVAAVADEVYLVVAGVPVELRRLVPAWYGAGGGL